MRHQHGGWLLFYMVGIVWFTACSPAQQLLLPTPQGSVTATTPVATASVSPDATMRPDATPQAGGVSPSIGPGPLDMPLAGLKICIDPGHQQQGNSETESVAPWRADQNKQNNRLIMKAKCSSGTQGVQSSVAEYIVNLQIALKLRDALVARGAQVLMTRESSQVSLSNIERAQMANDFEADLFMRIHCNGSTDASVNGMEAYVRGTGDGTAWYDTRARKDMLLAKELLAQLAQTTQAKSRGVFSSDQYSGLNWCERPSIILECGFMSNPQEDMLLVSEAYQEHIVEGVVLWLCKTQLLR